MEKWWQGRPELSHVDDDLEGILVSGAPSRGRPELTRDISAAAAPPAFLVLIVLARLSRLCGARGWILMGMSMFWEEILSAAISRMSRFELSHSFLSDQPFKGILLFPQTAQVFLFLDWILIDHKVNTHTQAGIGTPIDLNVSWIWEPWTRLYGTQAHLDSSDERRIRIIHNDKPRTDILQCRFVLFTWIRSNDDQVFCRDQPEIRLKRDLVKIVR
jgi:hypothetical protein